MEFIKELFKDTKDYIEIREISREGKVNQHFIKIENIEDYKPPSDTNIFFGLYSRGKRDGKASSCTTTKVLWADYDDMNTLTLDKKIKEVQQRIKAAGLPEPSILVNSGNGIHTYWLLDKRVEDEAVAALKGIAKATNGDVRATDKARILRLPNTFNVKDKPLKCEVVKADYSLIYNIKIFKDLLGIKEDKPKEELVITKELNIQVDRFCVAAMLKGVSQGERNFALGRITKWLQIKGYSRTQSRKIIIKWNKLNNPQEIESKLLNDFNSYWHGDYKLLGCRLNNPELQQILYKYCNRQECKFIMGIGNIELDNTVKYNNRLLNDLYNLTGNDLIIYGILARHPEGLTTSLLVGKLTSRATKRPCMSNTTRIGSINTLTDKGYMKIFEGNRREGKENLYKLVQQGTFGLGYTILSNGAINGAIDKRITPGELRLYVLLLKYAFGKGNCYPSLETLAKELRTTPQGISNLLRRLERSDYVKRIYKVFDGIEKLDIRLLV